ncbi:MAG: pyruvate ferredoxin oxidoreductase [Desulfobacterota bacterium]|nr:pyruvate ferredoxin oxidoreductase [Thermodesulfobacteriota bacterium]
MSKRRGIEASAAVAEAVAAANVDVIAAYPITPQTHIVERISEIVADGILDAEFICVESEHSALSACLGSAAVGARTFTATAGQGLELMHEVLYVTASMRLPVVMVVANRALSGPLNVWGDHSDVMAARDCGWIQYFAENAQEVYDLTICAFRIAEDHRCLFPVMVNMDGFHVSHVVEPVELLDRDAVASFLPPNRYPLPLHPDRPVTMGAFAPPVLYTECRTAQEEALRATFPVIKEAWDDFANRFGRRYAPVETYRLDGAECVLVVMGSFAETAAAVIDRLRDAGKPVGLIRLRLWRPFPFAEIRQALSNARIVIVCDRSISYGGPGGPVCSELKAALFGHAHQPRIVSFIAGLGGRDILPEQFASMVDRATEIVERNLPVDYEIIGVRQ